MRMIIIFICMILSGCSCIPTKKNQIIIPIVGASKNIDVPEYMSLPIDKLSINSAPDEIVKAYVGTVLLLKKQNNDLRNLLRQED